MKTTKRYEKLTADERQLISLKLIRSVSSFLQLFVSPVVSRRIISALLIVAGVQSSDITQLTGLCERSIRDLKKQLVAGDVDSLFEINSGRGRKSKLKDIETQVIDEIERGNYQTQQQIVDMIYDKFGVKTSTMSVSRFLKKTRSAS